MVAGARVQVPPPLLLVAHTSKVDLGARFIEVDSLQGLPRCKVLMARGGVNGLLKISTTTLSKLVRQL